MNKDSSQPSALQRDEMQPQSNHHVIQQTESLPRPPSIILRSSAKQLVSTTSTTAYGPIESTQFNSSLSKEPIVLAHHQKIQIGHRESVGQAGITLVSNSPNISVRSIPPSSRVLIRPSSSASNLQEHRSSHQLIRKQPISTKVGGQYYTNMLNVMKVELQQMNINFSNKLFQQIQKQNEQIQRLERTLRQNQTMLKNKDQQIDILKDKIRLNNLNKSRQFQSIKQMIDANYDYIAWKVRDLKTKLLIVADSVQNIKSSGEDKIIDSTITKKVDQMVCQLNCVLSSEFQDMRNKISDIYDKSLIYCSKLQGKINIIQTEVNSSQNIKTLTYQQQLTTYEQKIKYFQQILKQLKISSNSLDNNQIIQSTNSIKMKHYKLEETLKNMQLQVSHKLLRKLHLQEQFKQLCTNLIESQRILQTKQRNYQDKTLELNNQIQKFKQDTEIKRSQQSSRTRQNVVEKRQIISQPILHRIPSMQSVESLNVSGSSHRSKVENSQNYSQISRSMRKQNNTYSMKNLSYSQQMPSTPKLTSKLVSLQNVLKKSKKRTPLRCQIDEAGILKDYDQGIYIFSDDGDVFILNDNQRRAAVKNKLIVL